MITTQVKILKLFPIEPGNRNWLKAFIGVEVSMHLQGGNQVGAHTGMYHRSFWAKEFKLTDEEIDKLISE